MSLVNREVLDLFIAPVNSLVLESFISLVKSVVLDVFITLGNRKVPWLVYYNGKQRSP